MSGNDLNCVNTGIMGVYRDKYMKGLWNNWRAVYLQPVTKNYWNWYSKNWKKSRLKNPKLPQYYFIIIFLIFLYLFINKHKDRQLKWTCAGQLLAAGLPATRCQVRNPRSHSRKQMGRERSNSSNNSSNMEITAQVHHNSHILGSFWSLPLSLL